MAIELQQRLLTVDEYHKMVESGILTEEDRVELLNGKIICMSPIGSRHAACVEKIVDLLKEILKEKAMVRAQNPVVLEKYSEPEPDIALVAWKDNYYADRHPVPEEIFLIIEVADSTLEKDRQTKLPLYATAGIPEYWIVNLERREIEVYRNLKDKEYRSRTMISSGEDILIKKFDLSLKAESLLI